MSEMSREGLLALIRETYDARDPVPDGFVERMQEVVADEEAGLGLDLELMMLVDASGTPSGARSTDTPVVPSARRSVDPARRTGAAAYTLRFVLGEVDLLVRVAPDGGPEESASARIDGWVVPPEPMTVRALRSGEPSLSTAVTDSGRFEFTGLEPGLLRLRFEPHDGSRPAFATPTFEI
jgi:hypothetical protein